jgi:hypothetical protein
LERQAILERERRWARPAAAAAILAAPLYVISVVIDQGGDVPTAGLDTERYRAIEAAGADLLVPVAVRGLAFLCLVVPLVYLFRATQARSERISAAMIGFAFIGPVLLAAQSIAAMAAQRQVASDFVAQAAPGGDVFSLLDDLIDDSTGLDIAANLLFPAILGMLMAMIYLPLQAMRAGLLTRFFGTLGMALGAGLIFIVPAVSLLAITMWFMWLGFLFVDRAPGPRPPAWEAGVAIPWPRGGQKPTEPPAEEASADIFEGEATELTDDGPGDHSARGERARKRKRKRRQ